MTQEIRLPCPRWEGEVGSGGVAAPLALARQGRVRLDLVKDQVAVARVSEGFLHKANEFLAGSTMEERIVVFLQDFSSSNINRCNKNCNVVYLFFSNPFKEVLRIFQIQAPNMMHSVAHDHGVCSVHNLSRSKSQRQPAYYLAENGEL